MAYLIFFILLFLIEILYFRVADKFNIIDKPNERSSHNTITIRGGGIIFYIAALVYFFYSGFAFPWFILGLSMMAAISFLDDIFTLSNKLRLLIHFFSMVLMAYQLDLFQMPWYFLLFGFVLAVGVINAYNFMDGINGITVSYSLSVIGLFWIVNSQDHFVDSNLLLFVALALVVFAFFNFRTKAKCFAGDVGSVSIAYILLFIMGLLILKTGNVIYILFLSVYGVDAFWTIIRRLYLKENIFEAHRSHLYQILGNEARVNKLLISVVYGILQFGAGCLIIVFSKKPHDIQWIFSFTLLVGMSIAYLFIKQHLIKKHLVSFKS